jgi:O-antigen/teichoic acid export membrane protein
VIGTDSRALPSYRRSLLLVTGSGALVPLAGLISAPLLTQQLGVAGRGQLGAALAPNALIAGAATLGLPDAVAYVVARRPELCGAVIRRALVFTVGSGGLAALIAVLAGRMLAAGDAQLSSLIGLAAVMAVPALAVGVLRGAASGRQRWNLVAWERALSTLLRLLALGLLALAGHLTVSTALLVSLIGPVLAGVAYRGLTEEREHEGTAGTGEAIRLSGALLTFGGRVWLGGVATIMVARVSQLVIVPLSGVSQLGLYVVAVTISDIPWIVVQAVRDVVFGSSAAERNDARMLSTSRAATAIAALNSLVLGATLPWWLGPFFGAGFADAEGATWVLLASSVVAVPGLVAGAAIAAAGRPGVRSAAIACGLAVDVAALLLLVPAQGALGAAVASLLCTSTITTGCLVASRRVIGTPAFLYLMPTAEDLAVLRQLPCLPFRARRRPAERHLVMTDLRHGEDS